jgi:hypothetical protein
MKDYTQLDPGKEHIAFSENYFDTMPPFEVKESDFIDIISTYSNRCNNELKIVDRRIMERLIDELRRTVKKYNITIEPREFNLLTKCSTVYDVQKFLDYYKQVRQKVSEGLHLWQIQMQKVSKGSNKR